MQRYSRYLPKKPRKYRQTMHDGLRESDSAMMMPVAVVGALSPRASSFHRLSAIPPIFRQVGRANPRNTISIPPVRAAHLTKNRHE